ncbi:oligosaccharide flippase family protein [Shewanella sp. Isolate11]|nr:oligosaccharide flippase family protein [Shewanella sp. Isolate11]
MAFIFNLIIARELGAEQAGIFFIALSIAMLIASVSRLGFDDTVLRFTAANNDNPYIIKSILHFSLRFSVPVAILFTVLIYFLSPYIAGALFKKNELNSVLSSMSPSIVGFCIVYLLAMSLQARHKLLASIPCQGIAHFLLCGSAIIGFNVNNAEQASLLFSLSLGLSAIFFYRLSIRGLSHNELDFDEHDNLPKSISLRDIRNSAMPNWVITIMLHIVQWSAPIFIGVYLVAEQAAYFSVAQRVAMLSSFVLMAVNLVVAPKFAAFWNKGDIEGIRTTALFSVRLLILSAMPIVLLMLIFPDFLMGLFGDEFKKGSTLLQILVIGQTVNVLTGPVGYLLTMSGNERDLRFSVLVSGFGVLFLVPIFTFFYGAIGAAFVTAFFVSIQNLLAVVFVKKRLGFNTLKFWNKI